jgi:hypothetical protein
MSLDVWFQQDVTRILASTHETMTASMRATAPLDVEMAEIYQRGFADALRAVAIVFGVSAPSAGGRGTQTVVQAEVPGDGFQTLGTGKWG